MVLKTYITIAGDTRQDRQFETASAAWEWLIDMHEGRLRQAGKSYDRVLGRMEARSDHESKGVVSGTDPLAPSETITYSVQDW